MKQVDLTESMIRAIARQAEAERERRAKVIHAEGELQASEKLYQAAKVLAQEPQAIQLRYLETLTVIGADKNTTIVFPLPMDIIEPLPEGPADTRHPISARLMRLLDGCSNSRDTGSIRSPPLDHHDITSAQVRPCHRDRRRLLRRQCLCAGTG